MQQRLVDIVSRGDFADLAWYAKDTDELNDILDTHTVRSWRSLCKSVEDNQPVQGDVKVFKVNPPCVLKPKLTSR